MASKSLNTLNTFRNTAESELNPSRSFRSPMSMARMPVCWRTPNDTLLWSPLIDMYSSKDKFVVHAEVPGLKQDDITVSLVGNDLVIKGDRKCSKTNRGKDYYCSEIARGSFFRSVALPFEADTKKISATYSNGILEIVMPKKTARNQTDIPVKAQSAGTKGSKVPH